MPSLIFSHNKEKNILFFFFLKEEKIYFKVSSAVVVISPLISSALWAYLIGDELIIYFLLFTIIDFDICMKCQNLFSGETKNKKKKERKKIIRKYFKMLFYLEC